MTEADAETGKRLDSIPDNPMLNQKPFGIPIVIIVAAVAFLAVLAALWFVSGSHKQAPAPAAASVTQSADISQILALTDAIVAIDENPGTTTNDVQRVSRLKLIAANSSDVQRYLSEHYSAQPDPQYLSLLQDYLLLAIGPAFTDQEGNDANALSALESIDAATGTDSGTKDYERNQILSAIDSQCFADSFSSGIFIVSDYLDSGAYNIFDGAFRFAVQGSRITIASLPIVEEDKGKLVVRGTAADGSDEAPPFALTNAVYDPASKGIAEYGMLPFGIYPCNDSNYFAVEADRLIKVRTETPIACIGKDIQSPDDLDRLFSPDTNFGITKVTYRMSTSTYDKARTMSLPPAGSL